MPEALTLCECGCGLPTRIAAYSCRRDGMVKGRALRFIKGHNALGRAKKDRYRVEDAGYETACWVWQLGRASTGYGMTWDPIEARIRSAHRYHYEQANGPIPEGLHIDHLCRNRACVNPAHLEPVTLAENNRRSWAARREMSAA